MNKREQFISETREEGKRLLFDWTHQERTPQEWFLTLGLFQRAVAPRITPDNQRDLAQGAG